MSLTDERNRQELARAKIVEDEKILQRAQAINDWRESHGQPLLSSQEIEERYYQDEPAEGSGA
jgi:hypothetical protein